MLIDLTDLPSATEPVPGHTRSQIRKAIIKQAFSRRLALKGMVATGIGVGIASLDLLPSGPRAQAAPPAPTWASCQGWWNGDPDSSREPWLRCNPGGSVNGNVGAGFCGPAGWHRTDAVHEASGVVTYYSRRPYSCTGLNGEGKNAWVWRKEDYPPRDGGATEVRCSDGKVRVERNGQVTSSYSSACRDYNPS